MKLKIYSIIIIALLGILLSACTGAPAANSWPGMTLGKDAVYVSDLNSVWAVNVSSGSEIWRYPKQVDSKTQFYAEPFVAGDQLIVGDYTNKLYGLDLQTGAERWIFSQAQGHWIGGALAVGDTILAPAVDGHLYALDLMGKLRWSFKTGNALWAKPVSDGKVVYVTSVDHSLYAVNIENGKQVWSVNMGGALVSSPVLGSDGVLYVGTLSKEMIALKSDNGKIIWRAAMDGGVWAAPLIIEDKVYFGDASGSLYSLLTKNGVVNWKMTAGGAVTGAGAEFSNGIVFPVDNGDVLAVDLDGKKLWTRTVGGNPHTTPVVSEDRIIVAVMNGEKLLFTLDRNGNDVWSFIPPK